MNLNTEHVTVFKHNDWLSKTMGSSKKLTCEMGAEVDGKKLVDGERKIFIFRSFVFTKDVFGHFMNKRLSNRLQRSLGFSKNYFVPPF